MNYLNTIRCDLPNLAMIVATQLLVLIVLLCVRNDLRTSGDALTTMRDTLGRIEQTLIVPTPPFRFIEPTEEER